MEKNSVHKKIVENKEKLIKIKDQLKIEFIGLDDIIEEVTDLMMPWFLFPEAQFRPTIINMWGLTGSGKTALVNRLVELLEYKKLYMQMDMGEFDSDSASWIKNIFTEELAFFDEQAGVICFDEFQFARSINKEGQEIANDKLRVVWDILDSGKFNYIPYQNSYYMIRAEKCLMNLMKCELKGVLIKNGVIEANEDEFLEIFREFYFENTNRNAVDKSYFLSSDFLDGLFYFINDEDVTRSLLRRQIENADLSSLKRMLTEALNRRNAVKQLDLSKSLIFVLGNLDEAYYMSHSLNPDISANELHETTSKINISHIKNALKKRFRNEQIARLGNNHIIYKSFTNQNFRDIISQKLKELADFVKIRFNIEIVFDSSVVDIVYNEGVFPAQGTRPVFTTIKNLIEVNITKLVLEFLIQKLEVVRVNWFYEEGSFVFYFMDTDNNRLHQYEQKLSLKTEALRTIRYSNIQAHTAVHESGHAILASLLLKIIPSVVVSQTASSNAEGFCLVNIPEGPFTLELIKKEIMISLGGYIAEKLIFGEENTCSGVSADIERASELANRAVKEYAMGSDPLFIRFASTNDNLAIVHQEIHTKEVLALIRNCEEEAEAILSKNKLLLLKMSEVLSKSSRLEEVEILRLVCEFANEDWVTEKAFIKKNEYFNFDRMIAKQLDEFQ